MTSNTEAPFLDLNLSMSNDVIFTKIYDKRNDFDFVKYSIIGWRCASCYIL